MNVPVRLPLGTSHTVDGRALWVEPTEYCLDSEDRKKEPQTPWPLVRVPICTKRIWRVFWDGVEVDDGTGESGSIAHDP